MGILAPIVIIVGALLWLLVIWLALGLPNEGDKK